MHRTITWLALLVLSIACEAGEKAPEAVVPTLSVAAQPARDPSQLAMIDSACAPGSCRCRGVIDSTGTLAANGVDHRALLAGVECLAADFDGDGTTDVVLTGGEGMAVIIRRPPGGRLLTHVIDAGGMLELYAPRVALGEHGEPRASHHGLFVRDVGRFHVIFLWDGVRFAPTRLTAWPRSRDGAAVRSRAP